ncbi:hypothetical protein N0V83_004427 [Neocucurbitaria cava]|uniref:RING-type domain-containing protein n=1 Tax=Neocucurbitaria cava TaxID=798079 RepID=A0A9W8YAM6_9PLEO|nr:hypothetical protein N0V83_004427 [Neocucurbitaria cava]
MDQKIYDKRLVRWTKLLQYYLRSHDPKHLLERARQLLFLINRLQMSECDNVDPRIRMGSTWTWWDDRFDLETDDVDQDPNYLAYGVDPPNPNEEIFPETVDRLGKPPVDDTLRESRYELLRLMKLCLYQALDDDISTSETLKRLWRFFMVNMNTNTYLLNWHYGYKTAEKWYLLGKQGQAEFLATLEVDGPAMTRWQRAFELSTVEDPMQRRTQGCFDALRATGSGDLHPRPLQLSRRGALGIECDSFRNSLPTFAVDFAPFVDHEGFEEHCSDQQKWFDLVDDWDALYEDVCPVCLETYDIAIEATASGSKHDLWMSSTFTPVKAQCSHIMCLPCFKTWIQGDSENHDTCPICRSKVPPPNPQEGYTNEFLHGFQLVSRDHSVWPQRYAESILELVDAYLSRLPSSLRGVALPDYSIGALNLSIWRHNVLDPVEKVMTTFLTGPPSDLDYFGPMRRALCLAALEGLRFARERLEAFLNGDQERYRTLRKWQLYSRAYYENVAFKLSMMDHVEEI